MPDSKAIKALRNQLIVDKRTEKIMVTIRMARGGAKKKPFYNIVVTDSRKRRDSGYIERLGFYNPFAKGQEVRLTLDTDGINGWLGKGAQMSDRVAKLFKEASKAAS